MSDEIFAKGKRYISTQKAGALLGYDSDYIARLCRERKIAAIVWNKRWMVEAARLEEFILMHADKKAHSQARLSRELREISKSPGSRSAVASSVGKAFHDHRMLVAPRDMWSQHRRTSHSARIRANFSRAVVGTFVLILLLSAANNFAPARVATVHSQYAAALPYFPGRAPFDTAARGVYAAARNIACKIFSCTDSALAHLSPAQQEVALSARERALAPIRVVDATPAPPPARPAPTLIASPAPTAPIMRVERVVERIIERTTPVLQNASDGLLAARVDTLEQTLNARISNLAGGYSSASPSGGGAIAPIYQTIALTNKIDHLAGVTITGSTISGGSVTANSYDGTIGVGNGGTGVTTFGQGWVFSSGGSSALSASTSPTVNYITSTSTTATSTFAGRLLLSRAPTIAHTFSSWATGVSTANALDAALVVNPVSATGDSNLIAALVNGAVKFLVDGEGDIFANSLTTAGSVTLSTTTASTFSVEGNTTLGDASTDTTFINGTLGIFGTTTVATTTGNFGIGTSTPNWKLQVAGTRPSLALSDTSAGADLKHWLFSPMGGSLYIGTSTDSFATSSPAAVTITSSGRFGIGTSSPMSALDVNGNINFSGKLLEDGSEVFSSMIAPFASSCPTGWTEYTAARGRAVVGTPSAGTNAGTVGSALSNLGTRTTTDVAAHTHSVDPPNTTVSVSDPGHAHTIGIQGPGGGATAGTWVAAAGNGVGEGTTVNTTGITASVNIAAFTSASAGVASVDVTMPYIQLTYCQKTAGADIAEWTPSDQNLSPETIVSIDSESREKVVASTKAYDTSAIGIIATRPGWILGQETKDSIQLALAGRVPVRVSLKNGEIKPGDPITTSSIPGVGMKATRAGAIVGKAMEALNETSSLNSCTDPETGLKEQCGSILTFVNVSWYSPESAHENATDAATLDSYGFEPLGFDDDFAEGDVASLYYLDAPKQGHLDEIETIGRVAKADGTSTKPAVGVISTKIGGAGDLLRRIRQNNTIISEVRLIHGGFARMRIASDSPDIESGDSLMISPDEEGRGTKAQQSGPIIGRALEKWTPGMRKDTIAVWVEGGWYQTPAAGNAAFATTSTKSLVADAHGTWWDGAFEDAADSIKGLIASLTEETVLVLGKVVYAATGIFDRLVASEVFAQNVFADTVKARTLCLDDTCITKPELQELLQLRAQGISAAAQPPAPVSPPPSAPEITSPPEQTATSTPPVTDPATSTPPAENASSTAPQ